MTFARSLVVVAGMLAATACGGSNGDKPRNEVDGATASADAGPDGADGAPATVERCEATPPARHAGGDIVELVIEPTLAGKPVVLGEDGPPTASGSVHRLTTVRFFLSRLAFVDEAGRAVSADVVDESGSPLPYGVVLVDLEKPASRTVRARVPRGRYMGVQATVGLTEACNVANPADAVYPLNAGGGMTWTWTLGYVFVRLEGRRKTATSDSESFAAHGGAMPRDAPAITKSAAGEMLVGMGTTSMQLEARLDDLLDGLQATGHLDGGAEIMERLRADTTTFLRVRPR